MTWSGSGSYDPIGGTWDESAHTFTVSAATLLKASALTDVSTAERLLVTDSGSGQRVGASFGTVGGGITFSASPMSSAELSTLTGFTGSVLSGWDFTTNLGSQESLLSFDIGLGYHDLSFWHLSGGNWTAYLPDWQTYDANGIISFPVSSFSGYAVTGAVPEPTALCMMALGGMVLLVRARRR